MQAINRGEMFDLQSGLPDSMIETTDSVTWLAFAAKYVSMKWHGAAAKYRTSIVEALTSVTPSLVRDVPGRPNRDMLRRALRDHILPANRTTTGLPKDVESAAHWLERATLRVSDLADPATIRRAIDALSVRLDGQPAAALTTRRKRAVFYNALQYAVELEELEYNPIDKVKVPSRRAKVTVTVDRRVVVNPAQARELLTAVSYVGSRGQRGQRLVAFFACMYFAALRPAEALGLRERDCDLPDRGWGRLTLARSRPSAGRRWTDSGDAHDDRGLKHRGEREPRAVPIPPELVAILREHLKRYGTA
jgi:integrase